MTKSKILQAIMELKSVKRFGTTPADPNRVQDMYFGYNSALSDLIGKLDIRPTKR